MDSELEDQIDALINKSVKDLRTRIVRVVARHTNKSLKAQARELKKGPTARKGRQVAAGRKGGSTATRKTDPRRYHSDSTDSEDYYSD